MFEHGHGRPVAAVKADDPDRERLHAGQIPGSEVVETVQIVERQRPGPITVVLTSRQAGAMRQTFDAK
ncbi:MAG: hypothetical protein ACXWLK_02040 [Rhizomicrobium sp.]